MGFSFFLSDYWVVVKEMQKIWGNSTTLGAGSLNYMQGNAESFSGNLSFKQRVSYFDHRDDDQTEVPCGFFKPFPISTHGKPPPYHCNSILDLQCEISIINWLSFSDQTSMGKCDGLVVVSAIFNDHDKIRQPRGLGSKTLDYVCFFMFVDNATLNRLQLHSLVKSGQSQQNKIGAWRIVKVSSKELYENAAMNGVIPKYLIHRLFPNAKYSIWVDGKLQLVIDPLLLIHSLVVKENVDFALSIHPYFVHTMEEAMATARWKKWRDVNGLRVQMETYCENGLEPWNSNKPYPTGITLFYLCNCSFASKRLKYAQK